jgi:hypothetical protein
MWSTCVTMHTIIASIVQIIESGFPWKDGQTAASILPYLNLVAIIVSAGGSLVLITLGTRTCRSAKSGISTIDALKLDYRLEEAE